MIAVLHCISLRLLLWTVYLVMGTRSVHIDEEFPILITNSVDGPKAHFGVAVNLIKGESKKTNDSIDLPTGWVFIGAPKANSTHPNHVNLYETGVLWRCALRRNALTTNDCRVVNLDPTGAYDPKNPLYAHTDKKDGGWLGATIVSGDSDRLVSCASRWINQKYAEKHLLNGICYWIPKETATTASTVNDAWPELPSKFSYRLNPLLYKGRQMYEFPEDKTRTSFDWAYGQAGFSAHISENNDLILGAPGIYEWTGSVIQYKDAITSSLEPPFVRFNAQPNSSAFTELLVARVHSNVASGLNELQYNDYFGYAVTSGQFMNKKLSQERTQYAAGAPRSDNLSGKVLVFSFRRQGSETVLDYLTDPLLGSRTGHVGHYTSYFGSVLCSLDVNQDGWDDLLVGAPLYKPDYWPLLKSLKHSDEGTTEYSNKPSMSMGDEGCVFVYYSTGVGFVDSPQQICGDLIPNSRFGSAISNLNDLNDDGFNDVAVGAPYENDGRGAVYIYFGGIELVFMQKLTPSTVDKSIRAFGYSLSHGVDIDDNSYPDIAIGAYESNQIMVYRTVPTVTIKSTFLSNVPKLLPKTDEFTIISCVSFSGRRLPETMEIELILSIENQQKLITWNRKYADTGRNDSQTSAHNFQLTTIKDINQQGTCNNFSLERIGDIDETFPPIRIVQQFRFPIADTNKVQPSKFRITTQLTDGPIVKLSADERNPDIQDFYKKAPVLQISTAAVTELLLDMGSICEVDGDPTCLANVTLRTYFRNQFGDILKNNSFFILGTSDFIKLEIEIWNHRERANLPIFVSINWNTAIKSILTSWSRHNCSKLTDLTENSVVCSLHKPILENKHEDIQMQFNMTSLYGEDIGEAETLIMRLEVKTDSELPQPVFDHLILKLKPQANAFIFPRTDETSYYHSQTKSANINFTHAYEIMLKGPSPMKELEMIFHFPRFLKRENGKIELIQLREPKINRTRDQFDGHMQCTEMSASDDILSDFENVETTTDQVSQWHENDTTPISKHSVPETATAQVDGKVLRINCEYSAEVICTTIKCSVSKLRNSTRVFVEFKFSFLHSAAQTIANFGTVEAVKLESRGNVRILSRTKDTFASVKSATAVTVVKFETENNIPLWILLIAIATGFLVLAIVTFSLHRLGFFQRSKQAALLQAKKEQFESSESDIKCRFSGAPKSPVNSDDFKGYW